MTTPPNLSYRDAGVDIDAGNRLVDRIKPAVAKTLRPEVMGGLGGFGGLFALDTDQYTDPVLVSGTDGVGTKLKLANLMGQHDTVGIDLVAMCANDVLVQGAEPLFFLDYFACGKLDVDVAAQVVEGIAKGCEISGCALLGGETAEMPDMYPDGEYDLAGFCVGAVSRADLLDGSQVADGDVLIGLAASGPHSNGFSLIRRVLERSEAPLDQPFEGRTLGAALLEPTTLYAKPILEVIRNTKVHALSHITGGGLVENTLRVLPDHLGLEVNFDAWPRPSIFGWLAENGPVNEAEMRRVFNLGIGFVIVAPSNQAAAIGDRLDQQGVDHWNIGVVRAFEANQARVTE